MAVRIPSPPSHRRPTPDHPPYAEMVLCALKTLAEPHGSTESSISTFIQSNYTSLPWGHSKLLPYYLNKLLIAGEILRSKSDPKYYVLPARVLSLLEKKPVKKDERLQCEVQGKRSRGRPKKHKSISSENMTVSENAMKEQKGTVLKFKRKCPQGNADDASDGSWMFSNNETQEQEKEVLHGAKCNEQNNILLALPAFKSSNTKMEDNICNEKVEELQKKHVKGVEFDLQNEILLASEGKYFGDMKIDVNGKEMTLQEKDNSAIKIDDTDKRISVLHDKNCSSNVIAENGNEKYKDIGHMKIDVNGDCSAAKIDENDEVLVLQDKKCSLSAIADNGNEMLALQEKDVKGVEFNMQSNNLLPIKEKDFGGMENDVNGEEMWALREKDMKGVELNMQNENLSPLQEKDSGNSKIDVNGEETSALQEKDMKGAEFNMQNDNMLALKEKELGDMKNNMKGVEFNIQNENLFPSNEKDSGDTKIDVNGDEVMLASEEKDCNTANIDENDDRISVLQGKNHGLSVIADNSNECSLHEEDLNVCKNEDKGSLLGSMDTPSKKSSMSSEVDARSKKSKPKKLRKLWFES